MVHPGIDKVNSLMTLNFPQVFTPLFFTASSTLVVADGW